MFTKAAIIGFSILFSGIIGAVKFNRISKLYWPFIICIWIGCINEILSYVLAVRNLSAYYGLQYDPAYEYEVDTLEDTYVTSNAGGYLVHVFHDQAFGCGPHWITEVDVYVSVEGNIEERSSRHIFRDPIIDDVCFD